MARPPNPRRVQFNDNYYARKKAKISQKKKLKTLLAMSMFLLFYARNIATELGNMLGPKFGITITCLIMCCISGLMKARDVKKRTFCPKNPLQELDDKQFQLLFRFGKADIPRLVHAFALPDRFVDKVSRVTCSGELGLLVLLFRLHYPTKLVLCEVQFGMELTVCSRIFNSVLDHMYCKFGNKLKFEQQLIMNNLDSYAKAIRDKCGNALDSCFGFIDGTVHPICRPVKFQRSVWSGHKRVHGLKFQSVILPDGMFGSLFGPVEGRRHDATLLKESGLVAMLNDSPFLQGFYLFGDMGYTNNRWILSPVKGINLDGDQSKWNKLCRHVRIVVEWSFGNLQNKWSHLMFKPSMRVFLVPTAKMYLVAGFLCNVHNCLHHNQVSQYFALKPPSLEEYVKYEGYQ
jgi:hypothetical protein